MQICDVVAANVRAIRGEKRLSLEAAAKVTGVSKSMLGQIERGEVNPTISVLDRIAGGYHVPLTQLLAAPEEPLKVLRSQDVPRERLGDGHAYRSPIAQEPDGGFRMERLELLPGAELEWSRPEDCTVVYATVYRGNAAVEAAGERAELSRWDTLRLTAFGPCTIRNAGDQVLQMHLVLGYGKPML